MAVITPDGIVGKVKDVFGSSAQVLLINDHDSGAGVILEHSRLQGIVKGTPLGELQINDIMSDEQVEAGEHVITSGGDRIYPKGFSVGTVIAATPDRDNDPFLAIKIKPAADLNRLEEVLVITEMSDNSRSASSGTESMRAADILSQRLPSVPKVDPNAPKTAGGQTGVPAAKPSPSPTPTPAKANKPVSPGTEQKSAAAGGSAKPPTTATGTAATSTVPGKTGAETKKPSSGQTQSPTGPSETTSAKPKPTPSATGTAATAVAGKTGTEAKKPSSGQTQSSTASAETAAAKPKPTPKKAKTPALAPESSTPTQPSATPTATPVTQEKPPQ